MSFTEYKKNNRLYLKCTALGGVQHGFTTKLGGASHGHIEGLNLGFRVNDNIEDVKTNYRYLAEDLSMPYEKMVLAKQTHTDNIRIVTEDDLGKGLTKASDIEDTDGLITNCKNIPLIVFSADCTPILIFDPVKKAVGAIHAGWRGSVKNIAGGAIDLMHSAFGSNPKDILCAIGPSIGPCCFEIGDDIVDMFPNEYVKNKSDKKYLVDLWKLNSKNLENSGIQPENIFVSGVCTVCNCDTYYSYRVQKERTGRQGAVIML